MSISVQRVAVTLRPAGDGWQPGHVVPLTHLDGRVCVHELTYSLLLSFSSPRQLLLPPGVPGRVPHPVDDVPRDRVHIGVGAVRLRALLGQVPPEARAARHPQDGRGRLGMLQVREAGVEVAQRPPGAHLGRGRPREVPADRGGRQGRMSHRETGEHCVIIILITLHLRYNCSKYSIMIDEQ